jgi:ketosteroid isomerase-like protein
VLNRNLKICGFGPQSKANKKIHASRGAELEMSIVDLPETRRKEYPMKMIFPLLVGLLVLVAGGCAQQVDIVAERAAIRDAEREAVRAVNEKDADGWVAGFAEGASVFPPNAPVVAGKEAIREWGGELLENPGLALKYENDKTEVSRAADLGYSTSRYELTMNDPEGNPASERGKWVTIWKKQPDNTWKCVVDIWNPDQPAPGSAAK